MQTKTKGNRGRREVKTKLSKRYPVTITAPGDYRTTTGIPKIHTVTTMLNQHGEVEVSWSMKVKPDKMKRLIDEVKTIFKTNFGKKVIADFGRNQINLQIAA